jgi:O-antigen/teichoic acid export membrane protein
MIHIRLLSYGLRGLALLLRFVLLFVLARLLEPAQLGLYGLLSATVLFTAGIAGLGYSLFAAREVAATDIHERTPIIRDTAVFCALAYILILPLSLPLFFFETLPWELMAWFFLLLILEHVAVESERLLIAASRQTWASIVLFLRNGAWVLALIPVLWMHPVSRTLETVLQAWGAGTTLACAAGIFGISKIGEWNLFRKLDWLTIKRGLRVGLPLLMGALALKGLTTFDRIWVSKIGGLDVLAAYVFFIGIANAMKAFLNSSVFPFYYPKLVRAATTSDHAAFKLGVRSMILQTVVVTTAMTGLSLLIINPLLDWIDQSIYRQHMELFHWAQFAVMLYAISQVAQCCLYAHRDDRRIITGQIISLLVFFVAATVFSHLMGVLGILVSLCVAYLSLILIFLTRTFLFLSQQVNPQ